MKTRLAPILASPVLAALASTAQAHAVIDLAAPFTGFGAGSSVMVAEAMPEPGSQTVLLSAAAFALVRRRR